MSTSRIQHARNTITETKNTALARRDNENPYPLRNATERKKNQANISTNQRNAGVNGRDPSLRGLRGDRVYQ